MGLHFVRDFLLHVQPVDFGRFSVEEIVLNDVRADVTGHDDNRVSEIDRAPLAIGESAVVEHLQEDVEHVRVSLLNLVEQDHAVWLATDGLAELAAFLVANVARWGADQTRHGVFLHVLAHIDAHHRGFVIEQKLGERPRQLGFANAGWPHENERADRTFRILQTAAGASHGIGHGGDGFLLADHALADAILHVHELLSFAFEHLGDRDAGPCGNHGGDVFVGNFLFQKPLGFLCLVEGLLHVIEFFLQLGDRLVTNLRGSIQVAFALGFFLIAMRLLELAVDDADGIDRRLLILPTRL